MRYQAGEGSAAFSGPELANRVTPSVALLHVKIGAGGAGAEAQVALSYTGSLQMKWPSLSQPANDGGPAFGPEPAGPPRPIGGDPFGGGPPGGGVIPSLVVRVREGLCPTILRAMRMARSWWM